MGACIGTETQRDTQVHGQQPNTYEKLSAELKECLQCNTRIMTSECIQLKKCTHVICNQCMGKFIDNNLKNIDKYPFQCPINNCDESLDFNDILIF